MQNQPLIRKEMIAASLKKASQLKMRLKRRLSRLYWSSKDE